MRFVKTKGNNRWNEKCADEVCKRFAAALLKEETIAAMCRCCRRNPGRPKCRIIPIK